MGGSLRAGSALFMMLLVALPAAWPAGAASAQCETWFEPGTGTVCDAGSGMLEVFDRNGESLGFVHKVADPPTVTHVAGSSRTIDCAEPTDLYHIQVIYARASDLPDRYSSSVAKIRDLVEEANFLVYDAARAAGDTADLQVQCVLGSSFTIDVDHAVLPTRNADASFATIAEDLKDQGYDDPRIKYWVFYDDPGPCTCGGKGLLYLDDRPGVENLNNGNGVPMFAVTFGHDSRRIMLHELGHTMGAVQDGAPFSTGATHCYDGKDIMCYDDGGPYGHMYRSTYCSTEVFDCDRDTYFNTRPASGHWLSNHWNLGSRNNRYLTIETLPACSDGIDNDGDGRTDYPDDPGCTSIADNDEYNPPTTSGPRVIIQTSPSAVYESVTLDVRSGCRYVEDTRVRIRTLYIGDIVCVHMDAQAEAGIRSISLERDGLVYDREWFRPGVTWALWNLKAEWSGAGYQTQYYDVVVVDRDGRSTSERFRFDIVVADPTED